MADRADDGERRIFLRRWDAATGSALGEMTLFAGQPLARLPSADRRHLLITSLAESGPGSRQRYLWSIYSLSSGQLMGRIRHHRSADRFAVLGSDLLHMSRPTGRRVDGRWVEDPLRIRAVDLTTGVERWSLPLRDTSYRGPRPAAGIGE